MTELGLNGTVQEPLIFNTYAKLINELYEIGGKLFVQYLDCSLRSANVLIFCDLNVQLGMYSSSMYRRLTRLRMSRPRV